MHYSISRENNLKFEEFLNNLFVLYEYYSFFYLYFSAFISTFTRSIISASNFSHSSFVLAYTLNFFRLPFGNRGK